ncbi:MAG: hypothetical protein K8E66_12365, partial [Phycisphaerales bacterium]|nr:hypothetical protein [Phycisphaerales bacterium]
ARDRVIMRVAHRLASGSTPNLNGVDPEHPSPDGSGCAVCGVVSEVTASLGRFNPPIVDDISWPALTAAGR